MMRSGLWFLIVMICGGLARADDSAPSGQAVGLTRARLDALFTPLDRAYNDAIASTAASALSRLQALERELEATLAAAPDTTNKSLDNYTVGRDQSSELQEELARSKSDKPASVESLIIEGVLKFVQRRARDEAIRYVASRLDKELCGSSKGTIAMLPSTCGLLTSVAQAADSVAPLALLRQTVRADLRNLPQRLAEHAAADPTTTKLACGLELGAAIGVTILRSRDTSEVASSLLSTLESLRACRQLNSDAKAYALLVERVQLATSLLLDARREGSSTAQLRMDARHLITDRAPKPSGDLAAYERLFARVNVRITQVAAPEARARYTKEFQAIMMEVASSGASALAAYEQARVQLVRPVVELCDRLAPPLAELAGLLTANGVSNENAEPAMLTGAAVRLVGEWLAIVSADDDIDAISRAALAAAQFKRGEFAGALAALLGSGLVPARREPYRTLVSLAEFLAGLSDATTSEEIASLVEAAAPPSGSWQRKRRGATVGLSTQFGIAGGVGWTRGTSRGGAEAEIAAYIPVGLDLAIPARPGTIGLMLQVVDLGTVTSARLGASADDGERTRLSLASLFAPGGAIYVGVGATPFVLSTSVSYVPTLRELPDESTAAGVRLLFALTIDVPLLLF